MIFFSYYLPFVVKLLSILAPCLPSWSSSLRVTRDAASLAWSPKHSHRMKRNTWLLGCEYFFSWQSLASEERFLIGKVGDPFLQSCGRLKHSVPLSNNFDIVMPFFVSPMSLPFLEHNISLFRTWNSCMEINIMSESKYRDFITG